MKTTDDIDVSINTDDSDSDINWSVFEEELISRDSIIITEGGIYRLTGNISNVSVNTISDVKLILDNVTIKSSNGPAILIEEANNTVIVLEDNSVNILEDSENYETLDTDINGVIYSKDDLILEGNGSLEIKANYGDGITSLDDLKIIGGTYTITSVDDGIRGKDSVYIKDGEFLITSGGDGIKSTNDANLEKGYILIENGIFNIESELDGMQAETKLVIKEGDFSIKTGGGSENASSLNTWGSWGGKSYDRYRKC